MSIEHCSVLRNIIKWTIQECQSILGSAPLSEIEKIVDFREFTDTKKTLHLTLRLIRCSETLPLVKLLYKKIVLTTICENVKFIIRYIIERSTSASTQNLSGFPSHRNQTLVEREECTYYPGRNNHSLRDSHFRQNFYPVF